MSDTLDPPLIAAFWARVRAMFERCHRVIVEPEPLTPPSRRSITAWLALIETIVRKLLFAEAVRLRADEAPRKARGPRLTLISLHSAPLQTQAQPHTHAVGVNRHAPASARFKLAVPSTVLAIAESRAPHVRALWGPSPPTSFTRSPQQRQGKRTAPSARLAQRLEALQRVLADPAPHIRRFARLLKRLRPAYADRYARSCAASQSIDEKDPRLIIEAMALALTAAMIFINSS
jgi:hypothetical protein